MNVKGNSMILNGIEYVKADQTKTGTDHVVVIATNGWIFEGYAIDPVANPVTLTKANVVRSWTNGKGIGGLADAAFKDDYTRDHIGTITIHAVVAVMECRWI